MQQGGVIMDKRFILLLSLLFIAGCTSVDYDIEDNILYADTDFFSLNINPAISNELLTHCHVATVNPDYSETVDIGASFEEKTWVKLYKLEDDLTTTVETTSCNSWTNESYSCFNNSTRMV